MSTSLDQLNEMLDQAEKQATGGAGFETIAQVEVKFGYMAFTSPPKHFYQEGKQKPDDIKDAANAYARENGLKGANYGIFTIIHGSDVPTHPEGKMKGDWIDFVNIWHADERGGKRLDEEQKKLQGSAFLPWDGVTKALKEVPGASDLIEGPKWCLLSQEIDGYAKAIGNKREIESQDGEKKEVDRRYYVVKKVYATEQEAKTEASKLKGDVIEDDLSPTAKTEGWTKDALLAMADTINEQLVNAQRGLDVNGKKMDGAWTPVKAQEYICQNYNLEESDLALIIAF